MKRVVIIEAQLKRYRLPFVRALAARLRAHAVELVVAYSAPDARETRSDTGELEPGLGVKVGAWRSPNGRLVYQRAWQVARDADLVIVGQANGQLFNYAMLALSRLGLKRVAYWGHGFNHQAPHFGLSEWFKQKLLARVDWWFSYTPSVTRYLVGQGVDPATISTVYNTTDIGELQRAGAALERPAARRALGLRAEGPIGLYCGGLVEGKQLGFLVDAAAELHRIRPDFELVILGDGAERSMLEAIAKQRPFIRVVGPVFGAARAPYFVAADLCMLPARVGLAIADAFAMGIPLATTTHPGHGPELEYLEPGRDGIQTAFDVDVYAAQIAALLADEPRLTQMKNAATAKGAELALERMVGEFCTGILRCLELP